MLPLILSASLLVSSVDMTPPPAPPEQSYKDLKKYYIASVVGLGCLFGGALLLEREHKVSGGFALGVGTPLASMGILGAFEVYTW